ncbi:hypothetical protein THOB06_10029 [Vibrio rotiferianus]|nr:hypothetical protein THOG10_10029 [Vibrio rotiferianus]CAH1554728.1 hypothetical protein THOB06_10029 [Vibrio rotiferianus]
MVQCLKLGGKPYLVNYCPCKDGKHLRQKYQVFTIHLSLNSYVFASLVEAFFR